MMIELQDFLLKKNFVKKDTKVFETMVCLSKEEQ